MPTTVKQFFDGEDVRVNDPDDRILEATRDFYLSPNIYLRKGDLIRFNGKSAVFRPDLALPDYDAETTDTTSTAYGLRRGWLKPWKDLNASGITTKVRELPKKVICWFNGLSKPKK